MKHPALIQIRGEAQKVKKFLEKLENVEIIENEYGFDIVFNDVNEARLFISKLKKILNPKVKSSTKYAGLHKGRVRWLFTYSVRIENEH